MTHTHSITKMLVFNVACNMKIVFQNGYVV